MIERDVSTSKTCVRTSCRTSPTSGNDGVSMCFWTNAGQGGGGTVGEPTRLQRTLTRQRDEGLDAAQLVTFMCDGVAARLTDDRFLAALRCFQGVPSRKQRHALCRAHPLKRTRLEYYLVMWRDNTKCLLENAKRRHALGSSLAARRVAYCLTEAHATAVAFRRWGDLLTSWTTSRAIPCATQVQTGLRSPRLKHRPI